MGLEILIETKHFLSEPKIDIHIPLYLLQVAVMEAYVAKKRGKIAVFLVNSYLFFLIYV